ncbi:exopolysaccharide biosynthesis GT4 family glycosyltransferase EpsE [Thalassobius sp. S69A]|uniref:exopolysaccharide biosynthesis GT4 family glycosyltransferase EpsE n=1 Tax=unclassified Thalassovita TaxID=2619711 RepID=UPI000C1052AC|nr:colanic acid biosynthesis glycosyltransferase WcaL [Paracoccaceae bacterium]MBT27153.1 colanic acid biosynthesis glycosyltransferase WcaL [Paracoccaceae bacterium]
MPRKLAYLVPQFPGQTHIFFWREIQHLEKMGIEVHLFSTLPPPPGLISHSWSDEAMARTTYLGSRSVLDLMRSLPRLPLAELIHEVRRDGRAVAKDALICIPAAQRLVRECQARGITHIHAHSCGRAAMIAALANRFGGQEYSVTLHGPMQDYGPGQHFKWRRARFATIITQKIYGETQAELGADFPARVTVRGMGVDTDVLRRDAPYQPPSEGQPLRIFTCARLHFVKGHQDLMDAIGLLVERGQNVRLDIAGEDDDGGSGYRHVLEQKIRALNLSAHVTLLGAIDADEVKRRLCDAHLFVLASWAEPLGVAYMEAMSCATPTIGTDAGGVPELIQNGRDGILVPPKDPQAMADAIARLVGDPDLLTQLSAAGRQTIEQRFAARLGAETLVSEIWP